MQIEISQPTSGIFFSLLVSRDKIWADDAGEKWFPERQLLPGIRYLAADCFSEIVPLLFGVFLKRLNKLCERR